MTDFPPSQRKSYLVRQREEALLRLRKLIMEVPGVNTPWDQIAEQLKRLSTKTINAVVYRIETLCKMEYDTGYQRGRQDADNSENPGR